MTKSPKQNPKEQRPPAPRGRPPKRVVKIDDTPRNVARAFFGMRSTKFERPDDRKELRNGPCD